MNKPLRCLSALAALVLFHVAWAQFGPAQVMYRTPGANSRSLEAHDMNADGVPDLLMGTGRGVFVNYGVGGGAFGEPEPIIADDASEHVAVAIDVDGDAYTDVAYGSNTTGALGYLLANGDNSYGVNLVLAPNGYKVFGLWAVDWDNDGDQDLMVAREYGLFLHRNNTGVLGSAEFMIGPNFERPAADFADIDGDGWIDVVVGGWSSATIQYHRNTGGGQPQLMGFLHSGNETWPADIEIVDIDGDGDLDVLASLLSEDELHYYINEGGVFGTTWGELIPGLSAPEALDSGDIDGDGDPDLLLAAYAGGGIGVQLNNGDGTWTAVDQEYHSFEVRAVELADLNADNAPDICFSSYGDGRVAVALNDGNGTYPATDETVPCFGKAMRVETTELNGDDRPDVIVASYEPDAVAYALSQPGGGLGEFQQLQGVLRQDYPA
ncbi:MAG TPA: VCBS repeat-containing protein, partial [Flavobacteriales bacterium]|nr:VCBS repeat-containing protein [Flavobacteriales bacterium]